MLDTILLKVLCFLGSIPDKISVLLPVFSMQICVAADAAWSMLQGWGERTKAAAWSMLCGWGERTKAASTAGDRALWRCKHKNLYLYICNMSIQVKTESKGTR